MDFRLPGSLVVLVLLEMPAVIQSTMWKQDMTLSNNEFQSFLFKSAVRVLQECILICTVTKLCLFVTFNSFTHECKVYSFLDGPVPVSNTSLWKACQQCLVVENGSAFIVFVEPKVTYDMANRVCVSLGGHLATPASNGEKEQLNWVISHQLVYVPSWWIGGRNTISGWEWTDGRPLSTSDEYWAAANPSGNGNCLQFWKQSYGYRYDDVPCLHHYSFVCESDQTPCCL